MRLVMKNKDEGNELFRDGNHKHAAARYVKVCGTLWCVARLIMIIGLDPYVQIL